ncbi:MAG: hypothetical protein DCC58_11190 [Chloroflexi bacterium]|nr:MAG: hypothetical protein DCC58_11190 [Chloroflexota bacterium]
MIDTSSSASTVQVKRGGPGCLISVLWFIFIGSWLSLIWTAIAWVLIILIIPMPLGLVMINKLPRIATLREPSSKLVTTIDAAGVSVQESSLAQPPFVLRALYFVLIGWWLSAIWLVVAWAASVSLIGLPLAIWMYNRVPAVTTLRRY